MKTAFIVSALAFVSKAATSLVRQEEEAGVGYDQVRTEFDYTHDDLTGANLAIADWYVNTVKPKLDDHRDFVTRYALGVAEAREGELLDTCEAGTACRDAKEEEYRALIAEEWRKVMANFKTDAEASILKTQEFVNAGWQEAVQCEIDHPCCEFNETSWDNINKKIEANVDTIVVKRNQVMELQRRISEIRVECEYANLDWDSYDRKAD
jgi:hypothetical protein